MAIFTSQLYNNGGLPVSGVEEGAISSITGKITIPAGTSVASGDVFKFVRIDGRKGELVHVRISSDDFDSDGSPAIAATDGLAALRATADARKAFNSTTNPYLSNSQAAAVTELGQTGANLATALQTGVAQNYNPLKAKVDLVDGVYDLGFTLTTSPDANPNTDRTILVTVEFIAPTRVEGEFSGLNVYDYRDNSSGI
jgi:hypothetical protein